MPRLQVHTIPFPVFQDTPSGKIISDNGNGQPRDDTADSLNPHDFRRLPQDRHGALKAEFRRHLKSGFPRKDRFPHQPGDAIKKRGGKRICDEYAGDGGNFVPFEYGGQSQRRHAMAKKIRRHSDEQTKRESQCDVFRGAVNAYKTPVCPFDVYPFLPFAAVCMNAKTFPDGRMAARWFSKQIPRQFRQFRPFALFKRDMGVNVLPPHFFDQMAQAV